jgi:hypothetical protein
MMKHLQIGAILAFSAAVLSTATLASTRAVGQSLVYDLTVVSRASAPAGMPASSQARFDAQNGKPVTFVVTLTVDRVDLKGNGHLNGTIVSPALAALPASARAAQSEFQGTLAPDGQIIPAYDPSLKPAVGPGGMLNMTPAINQNTVAGTTIGLFPVFNEFAGGCAAHAAIKNGGSWHVRGGSGYAPIDYTLTAGAKESIAGHETVLVTMKGGYQAPYGSQAIAASGHYDPTQHIVVDLHVESQLTSSRGGPASETSEFKLRS